VHWAALRLLLAIAYPLLAHAASATRSGALAGLALADIAMIVLLGPLLARRAWAWALLAALCAGLVALAQSRHALLPLLAPPVVFTGLVGWWFARTLRAGQVPLISRIVAALDQVPPEQLPPDLARYTRNLTLAWAMLLAVIAVTNMVLALIAVPDGLLAQLGITPPVSLSTQRWSLFANLIDYGLIGGFFVAEYLYRKRRFPGRYHNALDFIRRMRGLGPAFWRQLFH